MTEIRALQTAAPAAEPAEQSVPFSIEAEQQLLKDSAVAVQSVIDVFNNMQL